MPVIILYFSHPAFPIKNFIGVRKKNNFDLSQHFHNMLSIGIQYYLEFDDCFHDYLIYFFVVILLLGFEIWQHILRMTT